ncbi:MAG: hypothetical protein KBD78_13760 [Oligoflexales bacterium]|nr:hypothetical protein [Oligoflexales bacterium]
MIEGSINSTDRLMRYMSFEKFVDMVCRGKIFVSRSDRFDDAFEGNYTQFVYEISRGITVTSNGESSNRGMVNNTKEIRESAFVSCWTLSETESMALWKLYGGKNSIAIETTVGALEIEIGRPENSVLELGLLSKRIVKVDYIDHRSRDEKLARELLTSRRAPLTKKPIAYTYEQEVRVIIDYLNQPPIQADFKNRLGLGIDIAINPQSLINQIYASPLADAWFFELLKRMLQDHGMDNLLSWSSMRVAPVNEVFEP